jgi:threonine synthase
MRFYSTNNPNLRVSLKEAIFKGLPDDNGLFMPKKIEPLPQDFIKNLKYYSFQEIAFSVAKMFAQGSIPGEDLLRITEEAVSFEAPVVRLDDHTHVLELFHGPSLAFKDFGARFMAQTMSYFNRSNKRDLVILVATSGDTGGAVAAGFYKTPGIRVVILYPSGKVSPLQEKQLTTLGHNVTALEIDGTFDDCQSLVKKAFLDKELTDKIRLSSANSINIARLIPQAFYYFEAWKQLENPDGRPVAFVIPSGNFGNLTAGLFAKRLGLPIQHLVAATNANDVVPEYLAQGNYKPRSSVRTLSNAMDVGNPSNFARMLDLYGSTWNTMKQDILGYAFTDAETREAMRSAKKQFGYILDPHGAVGYLAWKAYQETHPDTLGMILETAHPSKFLEDVESILGEKIAVPERLAALANKPKTAVSLGTDYGGFKKWVAKNC